MYLKRVFNSFKFYCRFYAFLHSCKNFCIHLHSFAHLCTLLHVCELNLPDMNSILVGSFDSFKTPIFNSCVLKIKKSITRSIYVLIRKGQERDDIYAKFFKMLKIISHYTPPMESKSQSY